MLIDWIAATLPLAATDEPGFIASLLTQLFLWCKVALGIGLVIFVHELGHFLAAKSFGVKCEKFYVGFDVPIKIGPIKFPRTLGKFTYGETEYGIGVIPLGGYVKMLGQDDDPRKLEEENERIQVDGESDEEPALDPRSFPAKPVWQRMIIISAGVVVNVITGILFAAMAFGFGVEYSPAVVGGVTPGGSAWQAGIQPGGKVVSIGDLTDDKMHFREMRMEILTRGLDEPDEPIDVAIEYDDGVREFELLPKSLPENEDFRMIGVSIPESTTLDTKNFAQPESVAADVLVDQDAGATVVAFNGQTIEQTGIAPGTDFFDYLYTHPAEPIELGLLRADGSTSTVTLPPQLSKTLGIRYAIGPVVGMIAGGPAEQAGMKIGDVIVAVGDDEKPDAYGLIGQLVGKTEPMTLKVRRGEDDQAQMIDLTITPKPSPQTLSPTPVLSSEMGVNAFGFAFRPLTTIAGVTPQAGDSGNALQPGDVLQKARLLMDEDDTPEWLKEDRYTSVLDALREGQEFSSRTPISGFLDTLQYLPIGTKFEVFATRPPEGKVIQTTLAISRGDRYSFERGLMFPPSQSVHKAESLGEALTLGFREGKRRFNDVIRFLKMLPKGRIGLKHVGGPLAIVDIAKSEAEKGYSKQLMFLTMLSMNLAILNFLPIPALDGGHMMFLLYELIVGKRANEQLEFRLTVAGLLTLLALMVVVFANDLSRYFN